VIFDASLAGRSVRVEVSGRDGRFTVRLDGDPLEVDLVELGGGFRSLLVDGRSYPVGVERSATGYRVVLDGRVFDVALAEGARGAAGVAPRHASGLARIAAPMPGKVLRVLVAAGAEVQAGQGLVVIEAMKMENEIRAPKPGRVRELPVSEGQAVETGALLAVVE
jgi:biotin carboxyl carrier protein